MKSKTLQVSVLIWNSSSSGPGLDLNDWTTATLANIIKDLNLLYCSLEVLFSLLGEFGRHPSRGCSHGPHGRSSCLGENYGKDQRRHFTVWIHEKETGDMGHVC